jgi:hypothetical protein
MTSSTAMIGHVRWSTMKPFEAVRAEFEILVPIRARPAALVERDRSCGGD